MQQTRTRQGLGGVSAIAAIIVSLLASFAITAGTAQAAWADETVKVTKATSLEAGGEYLLINGSGTNAHAMSLAFDTWGSYLPSVDLNSVSVLDGNGSVTFAAEQDLDNCTLRIESAGDTGFVLAHQEAGSTKYLAVKTGSGYFDSLSWKTDVSDASAIVISESGNLGFIDSYDSSRQYFDWNSGTGWAYASQNGVGTDEALYKISGASGDEPAGSYSIEISETQNGQVAASKSDNLAEGDVVSLTVTPDEGYELDSLSVMQGDTAVSVADGVFSMPAGNVTVTATFKQKEAAEKQDISYFMAEKANATLTKKVGESGYFQANISYAYKVGYTGELTADDIRAMTFRWYKVTNSGDELVDTQAGNPELKEGFTDKYAKPVCTYSPSTAEVGTFEYKCVVTWEPEGFNPKSETLTGYTLTVNAADVPAAEEGDFNLTVDQNIENGAISATIDHKGKAQTSKFSGGDTITVTATPAEGYILDELVFTDADGSTVYNGYDVEYSDDRAFATVTLDQYWEDYGNGNLTISATFKNANAPKYTAAADTSVAHGAITVSSDAVEEGDTVTFTVVPEAGYAYVKDSFKVLKASDRSETNVKPFGPFNNSGSFTMPAYDVIVTCEFSATTYAIQIPEFENGSVTADVNPAAMGQTVKLTPVPAEGYELDTISVKTTTMDSEGKTQEVQLAKADDGSYSFTMPADTLIVAATFKEAEAAPAVDPADQAAADKVIAMIEALPAADAATADTKTAADAVKAAYGELTEAQQALVSQELKDKMAAVSAAADKAKEEADKAQEEAGKTDQGDKAQAKPVAQTVSAKNASKTIKAKKLKKKAQKINVAKLAKVSAKTKLSFKGKANKKAGKFKIGKDGTITVKKGLKKGTYKIKMTATAAASGQYQGASKNFTVKIKVK